MADFSKQRNTKNKLPLSILYDKYSTDEAKRNIDENTKRKIIFPNGNVVIIDGKNDIEHILTTRNELLRYVDSLDFEGLKNIKWHFISYYTNIFGEQEKEISDSSLDYDKIIGSLKSKLCQNRFCLDGPLFENIVNEYVCDFLSLDYSVFSACHEYRQVHDAVSNRTSITTEQIPCQNTSEADVIQDAQSQNIKSESFKSVDDGIALYENIAIYKGKNNLLYSWPKAGKSYFSIEAAKNECVKKPLFIILEDFSGEQAKRYENNLSKKDFMLVNLKDFDVKYNDALETKKRQAFAESLMEFSNKDYHRIKTLTRQNYIEYGVIKSKNDKLDRISVVEKILADAIDSGHDFICIDSLYALIEGNGRSFGRSEIRRIIEPVSKSRITFLMLHHTTKNKNEMALTQELRNTFDNIYRLESVKKYHDGSAELNLIEENARDNISHEVKIKRTFPDKYIVEHEIVESEVYDDSNDNIKRNVETQIIEILNSLSSDSIEYRVLVSALNDKAGKEHDEANIKKILKRLYEKRVVTMKDNSTWVGGIKILKHE